MDIKNRDKVTRLTSTPPNQLTSPDTPELPWALPAALFLPMPRPPVRSPATTLSPADFPSASFPWTGLPVKFPPSYFLPSCHSRIPSSSSPKVKRFNASFATTMAKLFNSMAAMATDSSGGANRCINAPNLKKTGYGKLYFSFSPCISRIYASISE